MSIFLTCLQWLCGALAVYWAIRAGLRLVALVLSLRKPADQEPSGIQKPNPWVDQ